MAVVFVLIGISWVLSLIGFLGCATGRLPYWRSSGLYALANALCLLADVLAHDRVIAPVNGAVCVWAAFAWWKGGGGDGTKRRLRSLARKFTPTRRTAPAMAGA
jgi:apolipoprotein N-acyltransferase